MTLWRWRLIRQDDGSWQARFATDIPVAPVGTSFTRGALGVDLNAGFLSVAETDVGGNILRSLNYQTPEIGGVPPTRAKLRGGCYEDPYRPGPSPSP